MAEPQGNLADVACRLERVHRAAVAKDVRGHPLAGDRGLHAGRGDDMLGEDIFEPRPGHRATGTVEEQRGILTTRANRELGPEGDRCLLPQWQNALAPPLAHDVNAGGRSCIELVDSQPDQLGDAQTRGEREMQHSAIPHARHAARVGRIEQRLHLQARERGGQRFFALDPKGIDLFDAAKMPTSGDVTGDVMPCDAGTEVNEAPGADPNQAPRQAAANTGPDENGVVRPVSDGFTYPPVSEVIQVVVSAR